MAEVVYSPNAIANLEGLYRFLAEKNHEAATRALRTIRDRMRTAARFRLAAGHGDVVLRHAEEDAMPCPLSSPSEAEYVCAMQGSTRRAAADAPEQPARVDGRRQRSVRTRQAIIEAFLALVRENPQVPTGAQIAKRAGCSVRSIFERFTDRDTLALAAIDHVISLGLSTPVGDKAYGNRQARLQFQVETRGMICENWLPLWRALIRHESEGPMVKARIQMVRQAIVARLELMYRPELSTLPPTERARMLMALEALTDFEAWGRMREQYGLSIKAACEAWIGTIDRLLPPTPSVT